MQVSVRFVPVMVYICIIRIKVYIRDRSNLHKMLHVTNLEKVRSHCSKRNCVSF